jgi:signal transduction histidine kinase
MNLLKTTGNKNQRGIEMQDKLKIFIFDDDKADIKILNAYLKSSGLNFEAAEATSDSCILELLESRVPPDIIFLDLLMAGKGGMQWLSEITERKIAPIIMLTGSGDEITAAQAIKNGAFDYIPKGKLDNFELTRTINNCIERWKLQNERDALLGIAAHELRNPLAAILGYSEILSSHDDLSIEERKEMISIINERALYLNDVINNILNYSSVNNGIIQINLIRNDLLRLVKEIISRFQIIAGNKNINLELCTDLQDCFCEFDAVRIEEVISNLIDNAIKYSHSNSKIIIDLEKTKAFVKLSVIDNGQGIKEEELGFLFELFSNVKISSRPTAGEKSTGLGLAICKKIVKMHNGLISVKSIPGEGSTFSFQLPV